MSALLLSILVLLVGAALAATLRSNRGSALVAIVSQSLAAVLVLSALGPVLAGGPALQASWAWSAPVDVIALRVDGLSAFFLAWSLPLTLLGTIYAVGYLKPYFDAGRLGGPHFALLNLISLSFVLVYSVQNALVFLLGWEIAAVAAWLLVIWDYPNQKIRFAGFNYLVSTHVGLFVLVAAFMLLHSKTDSMDFAAFGSFLSNAAHDPTQTQTRATIFLLLGASFALKSAFFPFHTWLPRAHAAAPAHVSALMSGVIHKAGLFGLLRFTLLMGRPDEWMGWTVLSFGALSAVFGVMFTSTQRDLKRLLGYSSTENVGIAAVGFGVGYLGWTWDLPLLSACGFAAGLLHVLNHALFKCLLFYAAGSVYRATHTVDLERLGGLAKRLPATAMLFFVGALGLCALPPFNGFMSELLLLSGLLSGHGPSSQDNVVLVMAAATLAFVGAVAALSMTRAFGLAFLGNAREPERHTGSDAQGSMRWPMVLLATGVVVLGLAPEFGLALTRAALQLFPGGSVDVLEPLAPALWASRVLALGLMAAGIIGWRRGQGARQSVTWGCGYTAGLPRMQYTGSSFTQQFAHLFESILPTVDRRQLPEELLPEKPGHLSTHHPDVVERRMFEVLDQGEDLIVQVSTRIPEQPRFAFAAGLLALIIIGALLLGSGQ